MKIVISGAGTGGLVTAQGLKERGHEVVVLERGKRPVGPKGYRMALRPQAIDTLQRLLPAPIWTGLQASGNGIGLAADQRYFDPQLRLFREAPFEDDEGLLLIGPGPMRRLLAHGLEDEIRWETESVSYTLHDGSVIVTAADGSTVEGDLLVIAEGVHSTLRQQLLGDEGHQRTGTVAIGGRAEGRPEDLGLDTLARTLQGAPVVVSGAHAYGMFISAHDPSRAQVDPDAVEPGLVELEDAYLAWSVAGPEDDYPPSDASEADLRAFLDERLAGWHPDLRALAQQPSTPALEQYTFYAGTGVPAWPTTLVTILGDAVHAIPPSGAIGGSTAIRDAGHLVDAIDRAHDQATLVREVHGYEQLLRTYADDVVAGAVEPLQQEDRIANPAVHKATTTALGVVTKLKGHSTHT